MELVSVLGDHRFLLHPSTGLLVRTSATDQSNHLIQGHTHLYKLMVQSE